MGLPIVQRNRRAGSRVVPIEHRRFLKTKRGDVIAYHIWNDPVEVIIDGPVGYKRTWWLPEARAEARVGR
jgi:bifunctional DNA-binding transcriptional regulator/antitoxin component of YhaV-PrlF toxin-antitoxin module